MDWNGLNFNRMVPRLRLLGWVATLYLLLEGCASTPLKEPFVPIRGNERNGIIWEQHYEHTEVDMARDYLDNNPDIVEEYLDDYYEEMRGEYD